MPQKINERGDVVGEFIDSSGVTRGFVRFSDGSFSDPIVDPNDTVGFTEGRGINNSRTVAGDYVISDGTLHSFFLSGGTFTEYDVPGAVQTNLLSINDAGDFTGGFDPDGSGIFQAFVSVGGTLTSFSVPGAVLTFAYEINNSKQLMVGYYIDASVILHGYYRDASGALHFPIDPRAPLRQSCLDLTIGTGWWADMRTAQARLMDSSLSRQTTSSLSIIPGRPLHRLTESMTKGLLWSLRRCFRHCPRIPGSRQRHTADNSGGSGNEGERFPVAGHSTQLLALGVGRCNAGALRMATFILQFKTPRRTNQASLFAKCAARRVNLPADIAGRLVTLGQKWPFYVSLACQSANRFYHAMTT